MSRGIKRTAVFLLIVVGVAIGVFLCLPHAFTWYAKSKGFVLSSPPAVRLVRDGLRLEHIQLVEPFPATIRELRIPFHLGDLFRGNLPRSVRVDGFDTTLAESGETATKPFLSRESMALLRQATLSPFHVSLQNGHVAWEKAMLSFPLQMEIHSDGPRELLMHGGTRLWNQEITWTNRVDFQELRVTGAIHMDPIPAFPVQELKEIRFTLQYMEEREGGTLTVDIPLPVYGLNVHMVLSPGDYPDNETLGPDSHLALQIVDPAAIVELLAKLHLTLQPMPTEKIFAIRANDAGIQLSGVLTDKTETLAAAGYQWNSRIALEIPLPKDNYYLPEIRLICHDGSLRGKNLQGDGLSGDFTLASLHPPRMAPGQTLSIERMQLDNLQMDQGIVQFGYQDGTMHLQQMKARLFGGTVQLSAFHLPRTEGTPLETTLFFNRIPVQSLLDAYNSSQIQASGSFYGSLPIAWDPPFLYLNEGILFTEPGGGRLQLPDTELQLENAVPVGHPNATNLKRQLGLASTALRDLGYDYIQLQFEGTSENAVCTLKIKGQANTLPPHPLDFTLRTEGLFARSLQWILNISQWEKVLQDALGEAPQDTPLPAAE